MKNNLKGVRSGFQAQTEILNNKAERMEIKELKGDELDPAVLPCADPGFRKTLNQGIALRKEFLTRMMKKAFPFWWLWKMRGETRK